MRWFQAVKIFQRFFCWQSGLGWFIWFSSRYFKLQTKMIQYLKKTITLKSVKIPPIKQMVQKRNLSSRYFIWLKVESSLARLHHTIIKKVLITYNIPSKSLIVFTIIFIVSVNFCLQVFVCLTGLQQDILTFASSYELCLKQENCFDLVYFKGVQNILKQ